MNNERRLGLLDSSLSAHSLSSENAHAYQYSSSQPAVTTLFDIKQFEIKEGRCAPVVVQSIFWYPCEVRVA